MSSSALTAEKTAAAKTAAVRLATKYTQIAPHVLSPAMVIPTATAGLKAPPQTDPRA